MCVCECLLAAGRDLCMSVFVMRLRMCVCACVGVSVCYYKVVPLEGHRAPLEGTPGRLAAPGRGTGHAPRINA